MTPRTLAHYELLDKIGEGGMGEVHRARDTQLGREVAIKILPEIFHTDPERLARFEQEARLLASINHPGIAIVHGLHQEGNTRFLAMELVPGADLSERMKGQPIPADEVVPLALQIAEALEAAHEQGVVHRDLKPSNIMVTPDGRAKVLDFGLAKSLDVNPQEVNLSQSPTLMNMGTMHGVILGTAAYMSPEQARGKPIDRRCDIWSYGVILFEMLTGKQLFTGETVSDTMAEVLKTELTWADLPADTPPNLLALLKRCLDRDPSTRLRDIGEARIVLARIQAGETGAVAAGVAAGPPRPGFARLWGGWIVAALALAAAAVGLLQKDTEPVVTAATPVAEQPLRKFAIPMERDDPSLTRRFEPALSPDGRYLAFISQDQLWVRDLTTTEPRLLAGTEGAGNPFWSPDSRWIAYGVGQALRKIPREGGGSSLLATFSGSLNLTSNAANGRWTEDGDILLATGNTGLLRVAAQGGELSTAVELTPDDSDFHKLDALPDNRGLVFVVHDSVGYGRLDVRSPDGVRKRILSIDDPVGEPVYSEGHILFHRASESAGIWAFPFSLETLERAGEPFLVAAGGFQNTVSGDGTLVYVAGVTSREAQMVVVDRTGKVVDEVGPVEPVSRPFPDLSADGEWVLLAVNFGDSREVFRYHLPTGNRQRLTFNDLREDIVVFHPNGKDFVFYEAQEFWTYLQPLDGSTAARKLVDGIMATLTTAGDQVVFGKQRQGAGFVWDLVRQDVDGGEESQKVLVANDGVDWFPALSPNGKYVAYESDETGHYEVFITTYPDPSVRWQISTSGGEFPHWNADGTELYYTTRNEIFAVTVNTEGAFSFGTPRKLFERPTVNWSSTWNDGFAVTGDGQRFVMFKPVLSREGEEPRMVVVQNWVREFQPDSP